MKALGFLGKGSMDYGDVSSIDRGRGRCHETSAAELMAWFPIFSESKTSSRPLDARGI